MRIAGASSDGQDLICPWTDSAANTCALLGLQAVSPVLRDYNFPGPFTPMPHQYTMVNDLVVNWRFFNNAEMATGKTASSVWAALYLKQIGRVKKVLIVGTLSGLDETWATTIFKLAMPLTATIIHGYSRKAKETKVATENFFHIINFDGVVSLNAELVKNKYDLIVIDEARTYSNPSTARWKAMRKLIGPETIVWNLTGTPRPKSPIDVYGQVKLIAPWNVPSSKSAWQQMTMRQVAEYNWVPRPEANDICARAMMPGRVVRKADVLADLPPVTFNYVSVPMSEQQAAYYNALAKEKLVVGSEGDITAINAAVLINKLAQIASGCVYDENGVVQLFDCKERLESLHDLIDSSLSGSIVFAPYRHTVDMLMQTLGPKGFRAITGDTPMGERTSIFAGIQAGEITGVVATPGTMSHGITLTACSTTVWWSPINSTEIFLQANARTDRLGQKYPVSIYMLFASAVERKMYQALQEQHLAQEDLLNIFNALIDK